MTAPLTERLKLSGGLRLARGWQSLNGRYLQLGGPLAVVDRNSISDSYLTGRAALSYEWRPGLITYASVARGYTSGGFDKVTLGGIFGGGLLLTFGQHPSWGATIALVTAEEPDHPVCAGHEGDPHLPLCRTRSDAPSTRWRASACAIRAPRSSRWRA